MSTDLVRFPNRDDVPKPAAFVLLKRVFSNFLLLERLYLPISGGVFAYYVRQALGEWSNAIIKHPTWGNMVRSSDGNFVLWVALCMVDVGPGAPVGANAVVQAFRPA